MSAVTAVVVVGYLPAPRGEAALDHGIAEATRRSARLVVVNSSPGDSLVDERLAQGPALAALEQRLAGAGVPYELRQPVRGRDVAEEITEVVQELGAELVVIGIRRRTAVGKLLLGSAASRVLLEVPCPVLAVKADGR